MDARPLGLRGKGSQGESHYTAKNPPLGRSLRISLTIH